MSINKLIGKRLKRSKAAMLYYLFHPGLITYCFSKGKIAGFS